MRIPTVIKQQVVDLKTGEATVAAQQFNDNLNQQMQQCLSDDGFVIPSRTTTDITNIANPSNLNSRPNGTMWYDSTTDEFKGKVNGVVKVFTLT